RGQGRGRRWTGAFFQYLQELFTRNSKQKDFILLFGYNGTGKTRLSNAFRDLGRETDANGETIKRNTLYFNAYTEDLFTWDNAYADDGIPKLKLQAGSRFFSGLPGSTLDRKIRALVSRYASFEFDIKTEVDRNGNLTEAEVLFYPSGAEDPDRESGPIKISRGEENIFVWCVFLAVVDLALAGDAQYDWVENVYIDDPVSSLDEHNVVVLASHLIQLYRDADDIQMKTVVSTHHPLFFNVLHYELKSLTGIDATRLFFNQNADTREYTLRYEQGDTPSFHHVASLVELDRVARMGEIHKYHFNVLRTVLEKTAMFLGYTHFGACIRRQPNDPDGILHQRFVDLLSHGKYSLYDPDTMGEETRKYFRLIVRDFLDRHPFNPILFSHGEISLEDPPS
ncbi:MAG: AAA family ATPase, partial [Planctomycetota bacterium]